MRVEDLRQFGWDHHHDAFSQVVHAAAGHRRAAARAGRAAGEGLGAHLPRRPDGPGRQLGAAAGVDRRVRAQWAAHRAEASAGGSDGGAWLDGDAAPAMACDAAMAPIVTGEVNLAALDDLVRLCVELDRLRRHGAGGDGGEAPAAPGRDTTRAWEALEQAIIGKAVDLLSGPGGLASFLRRRQLGARLGGPSLPLDIGYSETIPASIRNAVILRDQHCQWAGRCNQPAGGMRGAPCQAQEERRQDQRSRLCSTVLVSPPGGDPPVGLDPGPEPRRHHHRLEPGQDQGPAQPQPTCPSRVTPGRTGKLRTSRRSADPAARVKPAYGDPAQIPRKAAPDERPPTARSKSRGVIRCCSLLQGPQFPDELDGFGPCVGARRLVRGFVGDLPGQETRRQRRKQISEGVAGLGVLQDRVAV